MSTQTLTDDRVETTHIPGSESCHWVCPDGCGFLDGRQYAYCGTDVTDHEEASDLEEVDCVVCEDLGYCPICDPPRSCDG